MALHDALDGAKRVLQERQGSRVRQELFQGFVERSVASMEDGSHIFLLQSENPGSMSERSRSFENKQTRQHVVASAGTFRDVVTARRVLVGVFCDLFSLLARLAALQPLVDNFLAAFLEYVAESLEKHQGEDVT